MNNFQLAMVHIAKWEWSNKADGQYTNDPVDPGGETRYGISKRGNPSVDIKNLTLQGAMDIYQTKYWNANNLDKYDSPYCITMMDGCVNIGASRALDLDEAANGDWKRMITARRDYYGRLIMKKPALQRFLVGWTNRLNDLSKYCASLEQGGG